MIIKIYEEEMLEILSRYLEENYALEKSDAFITFDDDKELNGLHFTYVDKNGKALKK